MPNQSYERQRYVREIQYILLFSLPAYNTHSCARTSSRKFLRFMRFPWKKMEITWNAVRGTNIKNRSKNLCKKSKAESYDKPRAEIDTQRRCLYAELRHNVKFSYIYTKNVTYLSNRLSGLTSRNRWHPNHDVYISDASNAVLWEYRSWIRIQMSSSNIQTRTRMLIPNSIFC